MKKLRHAFHHTRRITPRFFLHACPRCGGDLFLFADGERRCFQCGSEYVQHTELAEKVA
jgi:uncharacterized Zn finger protein (UPF0148 family)